MAGARQGDIEPRSGGLPHREHAVRRYLLCRLEEDFCTHLAAWSGARPAAGGIYFLVVGVVICPLLPNLNRAL
jgi:hypothetical protein